MQNKRKFLLLTGMDKNRKILSELDVLVLDCQATSNNPDRGFLLEIGWMKYNASYNRNLSLLSQYAETYLIKKPGETKIPPHIKRITGLDESDFSSASDQLDIWRGLCNAAAKIAASNRMTVCPAIIHFAQYEMPFLKKLHKDLGTVETFPFEIFCTHKIIKRLQPNLPRNSLRAIAGYFGHSVPVLRRCAHHTIATSVIWFEVIKLLKETQGILTVEELSEWPDHSPPSSGVRRSKITREYPMDSKLHQGLPDQPGVYFMRRGNGDPLYIGKAKSLKRRVNSYFQKRSQHREEILEMLTQVQNLDIITTESALEASLLESDEIKRLSHSMVQMAHPTIRVFTYLEKERKGRTRKNFDYF